MLTLFHAPMSRSSRIVTLIDEMGIADQITLKVVNITRMDGSGGADPGKRGRGLSIHLYPHLSFSKLRADRGPRIS